MILYDLRRQIVTNNYVRTRVAIVASVVVAVILLLLRLLQLCSLRWTYTTALNHCNKP